MTKAPFNPTTTYAVAPTRSFVANTFQQSTRIGNTYLNNEVTTNKRTTLKLFNSCQFGAEHLIR